MEPLNDEIILQSVEKNKTWKVEKMFENEQYRKL